MCWVTLHLRRWYLFILFLYVWRYWDTDTIVIEPFVYFLPQFLQNPETLGLETDSEGAAKVNHQQAGRKLHLNWTNRLWRSMNIFDCLHCSLACVSCWKLWWRKNKVETPLEGICLQFKVSQPFYFHILASTEEPCITNCYFKLDETGYRYLAGHEYCPQWIFGTRSFGMMQEAPCIIDSYLKSQSERPYTWW